MSAIDRPMPQGLTRSISNCFRHVACKYRYVSIGFFFDTAVLGDAVVEEKRVGNGHRKMEIGA